MNRKRKMGVMGSAISSLAICLSLIATATFAIFVSESEADISITSGKVSLSARMSDLEVYSPKLISSSEGNAIIDSTDVAIKTGDNEGLFYNGGSAKLDSGEGTVTLDKMTPGDKANFTMTVINESTVNVKYRTLIKKVDVSEAAASDENLFGALSFSFDGHSPDYASAWKYLEAPESGESTVETYPCSIELPTSVSGAEFMDKSCKVAFIVEAVQSNVSTLDASSSKEVEVTADDTLSSDVTLSSIETVVDGTGSTVSIVSAQVPAGTKVDEGTSSLTLKVYETSTPSNFEASSSEEVTGQTIEVEISGVNESNEEIIVISLYLGTSIKDFKLYHDNEAMKQVTSASEVDADQEYYYDSSSGIVTFATSSFSPFTSTHKSEARIGSKYYDLFSNAVLKAIDGDTVELLKDCEEANGIKTEDAGNDASSYQSQGDITLDFAGHSYSIKNTVGSTNSESQAIHLGTKAKSVTMKNGTVIGLPATNAMKMLIQNYIDFTATNMVFNAEKVGVSDYGTQTGSWAKYDELEIPHICNSKPSGKSPLGSGGTMTFNGCTLKLASQKWTGLLNDDSTGDIILNNTSVNGVIALSGDGDNRIKIRFDSTVTNNLNKNVVYYFHDNDSSYAVNEASDGEYTIYSLVSSSAS